jgi:hypothetical protein
VVRQRWQQKVVHLQCLNHHRRRFRHAVEQLPFGHAADQVLGQLCRVERLEAAVQAVHRHRPVDTFVEGLLEDVLLGLGDRHRLPEQLVQQLHLDVEVAQGLGEGVVLLLGVLDPQDVVEEVLVVVRGRQPLQLHVRPVQDRLSQASNLRIDVQGHGCSLCSRSEPPASWPMTVPKRAEGPELGRPLGTSGLDDFGPALARSE